MLQKLIIDNITKSLETYWPGFFKKILIAVLVFVVIYYLIKFLTKKAEEKIESNVLQPDIYSKKISALAGNIIYIVLMIFNVLAVFQIIGFDMAILMWWISLALWFASQTTISNMVSWIMIIINKKIRIWDLIEFTGTLNIRWTIEEVNTKHTVVRMFDKRRVIIPNSIVASTPVKTIKLEELIRWEFMIKIPRNIEVSAIRQMLIKIINETDWVIHQEYSNIIVSWFDTSWIIIKWFFFVNPQTKRNVFAVNMDLKNKILETFKKYWIKIPYNHLTINIER